MSGVLPSRPGTRTRTTFTVTGHAVVTIAVDGAIDAGAARGLEAIVDWLAGSPEVVIDLRECAAIDDHGFGGLSELVARLRGAGSAVSIQGLPAG